MTDHKDALKKEICDYFWGKGVRDTALLGKICKSIKSDAEAQVNTIDLHPEIKTLGKLGVRHHAKVTEFISRLVVILEANTLQDEPVVDEYHNGNSTDYYTSQGKPIHVPAGLRFLPHQETVKYVRARGYVGE